MRYQPREPVVLRAEQQRPTTRPQDAEREPGKNQEVQGKENGKDNRGQDDRRDQGKNDGREAVLQEPCGMRELPVNNGIYRGISANSRFRQRP